MVDEDQTLFVSQEAHWPSGSGLPWQTDMERRQGRPSRSRGFAGRFEERSLKSAAEAPNTPRFPSRNRSRESSRKRRVSPRPRVRPGSRFSPTGGHGRLAVSFSKPQHRPEAAKQTNASGRGLRGWGSDLAAVVSRPVVSRPGSDLVFAPLACAFGLRLARRPAFRDACGSGLTASSTTPEPAATAGQDTVRDDGDCRGPAPRIVAASPAGPRVPTGSIRRPERFRRSRPRGLRPRPAGPQTACARVNAIGAPPRAPGGSPENTHIRRSLRNGIRLSDGHSYPFTGRG